MQDEKVVKFSATKKIELDSLVNKKVSVDIQTTIQILEKIDQYWVKVSLFLKKSLNF